MGHLRDEDPKNRNLMYDYVSLKLDNSLSDIMVKKYSIC